MFGPLLQEIVHMFLQKIFDRMLQLSQGFQVAIAPEIIRKEPECLKILLGRQKSPFEYQLLLLYRWRERQRTLIPVNTFREGNTVEKEQGQTLDDQCRPYP